MNPLTLFSLKENKPRIGILKRFFLRNAYFFYFYLIPFGYAKRMLFYTKPMFDGISYMAANYTLDLLMLFALHAFAINTWLYLKGTPRK